MRAWMTRESGGAPYRLVVLVAVAVAVALAVAVVAGLTIAAPRPASSTPAASPTAVAGAPFTLPAEPRLLVLGDSYTEGFAADPESTGYAYLVGASLGWRIDVDGASGTGYTYGGGGSTNNDYGTRIREYIRTSTFYPNVIVLQGSQNDYRSISKITAKVVADVNLLRDAYPGVRIVLFGPAAPQPLQSQLGPIDAADQAAATRLGLPYISPFQEKWLTVANTKQYGYSDGSHLNSAGHRYLAERFLTDFKSLFRE